MNNFKLFTDRNGNEKNINTVVFRDIKKILTSEMHEGYYIDFKKDYNIEHPNPKIAKKAKLDLIDDICSFANNEGGWLIFGIEEDENRNFIDCPITKKTRLDYNQQISEILNNGDCNPKPNFETKFVTLPQDKSKGYLLIHVLEGINTPYISNGRIKTRLGSSAKSVDIKERNSLDFLYKKRKNLDDEMKEFCKREIYYAPTFDSLIRTKYEMPLISVYIKSNSSFELRNYEEIEKLAKMICNNTIFRGYYFSSKSIIFYNAEVDHSKTATAMVELFFDYSIKMHIPLPKFKDNDISNIINSLPANYHSYDFKKYVLFDGISLVDIFISILNLYNKILEEKLINVSNAQVAVTFENTQNCIFIRNQQNYYQFIAQEGLKQCILSSSSVNCLLKPFLDEKNKINIFPFVNEMIIMHFGILVTDIKKYNLLDD